MINPSNYKLKEILENSYNIAAVGASDSLENASSHVVPFVISKGYNLYPVNPNAKEVAGRKSYPNLDAVAAEVKIDIISSFRRSEFAPELVREAARLGVPVVWQQDGLSADAAKLAEELGITFVSNICIGQTIIFLDVKHSLDFSVLEYLLSDFTEVDKMSLDEALSHIGEFYKTRFESRRKAELLILLNSIMTNNIDITGTLDKLKLPFDVPGDFIQKVYDVL